MEESKEEFLRQYGEDYGYPNSAKGIDDIRSSEFKRLDGLAYLDHAGAGLYSEKQMEAVLKDLTSNVYGNPHSQSDASWATSEAIRVARQLVLEYCNASPKDYKCIFTSGATAALKLVGEAFPWSRESCYMYTMENHNSVLGIREYALDRGAAALAIEVEEVESLSGPFKEYGSSFKVLQHPVQRRAVESTEDSLNGETCHLFAFPSECNFTGMKFSMDLVNIVKEDTEKILKGSFCRGRWMVLIDAAKGCATQPPDLSRFPADFVVLSFYKIFGYPSGLGALIARTEAANMLKKTYFSGGTVSASIANIDFVKRREGVEERLEDGTQSFLNISSIRHGFNIINTLTTSAIVRHTTVLASYVRNKLMALRHENGAVVCTIYGSNIGKVLNLGPTIAFNLKRPDGSWFGYREVEKLASLSGIQLRTGCFCNPGACAKYLGLSTADLLSNVEAGHVCWDDNDILHGKPTGAVRVSFGYMSTFEDAKKFIMFIRQSFAAVPYIIGSGHISRKKMFSGIGRRHLARSLHLESITVYPIKSCSGFSVDRWALNNTGLQYDREWLIKGINGDIFTQKKVPEMCLINTIIDLNLGKLFVESPSCKVKLEINLDQNLSCCEKEELELLGQRYQVQGYDEEVNMWFAEALARPCMLLRYCGSEYLNPVTKRCRPQTCRDEQSRLNFVNEAQFLLISEESVCDLNDRLSSNAWKGKYGPGQNIHVDAMRFRPNLIISGAEPYEEDSWRRLTIGGAYFTSLGGCNRCEMINLDFQSGEMRKSKEPLATLASFRRVKGKILFGILLRYDFSSKEYEGGNEETWLEVGQKVHLDMS